ncbi:hypothetical protein FOYG_07041 [Fusarium oxysporum NRRL 32931]|nr:hypothetical protein FOYG_07041 [Fusarium oxysporum NRRL 32931]
MLSRAGPLFPPMAMLSGQPPLPADSRRLYQPFQATPGPFECASAYPEMWRVCLQTRQTPFQRAWRLTSPRIEWLHGPGSSAGSCLRGVAHLGSWLHCYASLLQ